MYAAAVAFVSAGFDGGSCHWCAREIPCPCAGGPCMCQCGRCQYPLPLSDDGPRPDRNGD